MSDEVYFDEIVTKGLEPIESDGRFFEGYLTVQVKDKQGEVTIVDELYKVLPIWMDRGAPITDTHSNRVVGKGINFARADYTDADGTMYPAIKITGKIHKDYELDNEIWKKIKSGEYKGLSFGGSTKTDRQPMRMKDGSIAYSLSKLEHYEVAVCRDPAVPLAVITDYNPIAKSNIECDNTGCYVTKPILGAPDFKSAKRKVMRESGVPAKNAERIVGAAEAGHLGKGNVEIVKGKCTICGGEYPSKTGDKDRDEELDILHESMTHGSSFNTDPKRMRKKGNPNLPYNEEYFKKDVCNDCGLPKKKADKKKGKQVKERKKRKKQSQGIGNKRGWGAYKSIIETNKILEKYQGNAISLARILDKTSPRDIRSTGNKQPSFLQSHGEQSSMARGGHKARRSKLTDPIGDPRNLGETVQEAKLNAKGKKRKPKTKDSLDNRERVVAATPQEQRQSHGGQSTDARITGRMEENRRGLTSNQMYNRRGAPHGKISRHDDPDYKAEGETQNPEYRGQSEKKRKIPKTSIAPKIASLFDKIKRDISKKKLKKVGSGAMVDPNQANQGAGFAIRNQTPPRRKKVRTMQAKLGDGTYDYSS